MFIPDGEIVLKIGINTYIVSYHDSGKAYDIALYNNKDVTELPDEAVDAMLNSHSKYIGEQIAESMAAQRERYEDEQREMSTEYINI